MLRAGGIKGSRRRVCAARRYATEPKEYNNKKRGVRVAVVAEDSVERAPLNRRGRREGPETGGPDERAPSRSETLEDASKPLDGDGTPPSGKRRRGRRPISSPRMTPARTVCGFTGFLVLVVPVTVCATIVYVNEEPILPPRCYDPTRKSPHQTLAKCKYDADCMDDAYCWNQEGCLCKDHFIVYRNRSHVLCLKVARTLGDPCVADVQCQVTFTPRSECRDSVCQCSPGSHFYEEEGRCYESVGLGEKCQTNQNCYLDNSFCDTGYCGCALQHHLSSDNSTCLKDVLLHEKCSYDDECISANTRCMQTCKCKVDYVLSSDESRCLKAANQVGEGCEENTQCVEFLKNSECVNGTCKCTRGFHQRGPVCLRNVDLGGRCETHRQCITARYLDSASTDVMNVDCINNVCSCAPDYIMAEELNDCVRYSDNGVPGLQDSGMLVLIATSLLISRLRLA